MSIKLFDGFGRKITHLRISVTQRCNLDCFYCHREGEKESGSEMSLEKIIRIGKLTSEIGAKNVKITGGEPLMRKDIVQIVEGLSSLKKFADISITTNGLLLQEMAKELKHAGLNRVNIGCDSLSSSITRKNIVNIMPGITAARISGLKPIKLNMVVLRNINHDEIDELIEFANRSGCILQLNELIPGSHFDFKKYHYPLKRIEQRLKAKADRMTTRKLQSRRQYHLDGAIVEIVRPTHPAFCRNCNKIRVTSDGKIKPCLMRDDNLVAFSGMESIIDAVKKRELYHGKNDRHIG